MTVPRLKSQNRVRKYRQNLKPCSSRHQKKHQRNPYVAALFYKITLAEPDSTDLRYITIGKDEGAKLHWGGEILNRENPGFYLQPALFTEVDNRMQIAREEIFGPVAGVIRVKDYEEAVAVANDTDFGLSTGICTTSLKYASHFKRNAEAGMVMVNLPTAGVDYHVPFGGRKGSSYGPREQGRYAVEFYTTVKTAYTLP
jgi:alpha-ketoglutaric semialdehyde dehydrogenase